MRMKHHLILALLAAAALPSFSKAQNAGDWSAGAVFQPFMYWKYNKSDWNNRPLSYPESPDNFNGFAAGLSAAYSISDLWGVGAELTYSTQKQEYNIAGSSIANPDGSDTYHYYPGSYTQLGYLKIPVFAAFNLEIGHESGLFFKFMGGPQLSINVDYHAEFTRYQWDIQANMPSYDLVKHKTINTPFHLHHEFMESDGSYTITDIDTEYLYRRFEFGVIGGVALQKKIFQFYTISLGARYELGLTDIENPKEDKAYVTFGGLTGSDGLPDPRPATYNRRLVMDIGISRIIE